MSSGTLTDGGAARLKPRATKADAQRATKADGQRDTRADGRRDTRADGQRDMRADTLRPWQFFVLAALGCATAVTFVARAQGPTAVVLLSVMIGAMALVGIAALRTLNPFVTTEADRTVMIGTRTRAALEREKTLALRAIKELEFDRAMGKVSDADFHEMASRLRARAARLMKQLDSGGGYREQIERDLEKRLGGSAKASAHDDAVRAEAERSAMASAERGDAMPSGEGGRSAMASAERDRNAVPSGPRSCVCGTSNDADARFCKSCGARL